jgi:hypothetical protein
MLPRRRAPGSATGGTIMRNLKPIRGQLGRIGLAFAALISIAAVAGPAAADDWNHHRQHHDNGFFSFGFGSPGYYYAPPPAYYYAPPPRYYYYPPPAYYYPPPAYYGYGPSASFNFVVPFGHHRR